jgi:hypothetical protein
MTDRSKDVGELTLRYPVFAVVTAEGPEDDGLVVLEVDGKECLPLFLSRELAELYVEQVREAGQDLPFELREQSGDAELEHLLAQLPPSIAHVVWDTTLPSQAVKMTALRDLRQAIKTRT